MKYIYIIFAVLFFVSSNLFADQTQDQALAEATPAIKKMKLSEQSVAESFTINILKYMADNVKFSGSITGAKPRDPHEWTGKRVLAEGDFNGCVEAAKLFKTLCDAVAPDLKCTHVGGTFKKVDGGHAVVEVFDAKKNSSFLVDTSRFEELSGVAQIENRLQSITVQTNNKDFFIEPTGFKVTIYKYGHLKEPDAKLGKAKSFKTITEAAKFVFAGHKISFNELRERGIVLQEENGKFRCGDKYCYIYLKSREDGFSGNDQARVSSGQREIEDKVKFEETGS